MDDQRTREFDDRPEPTQDDLDVADQVLGRMDDPPRPGTPKYEGLRIAIASMRAFMGPDRFALTYGLREPRNWLERLELQLQRGEITEDEFFKRGDAMTERAIDFEMLNAFCDECEERVSAYQRMLQAVVEIATDDQAGSNRDRVRRIDAAVARMGEKYGLSGSELETVLRFLLALRAEQGDPVRCGEFTGETAHFLATQVCQSACRAWRETRGPALDTETASAQFYRTWIARDMLPMPSELSSRIRLERARAEKALREQDRESRASKAQRIDAALVEVSATTVNIRKPAGEPRKRTAGTKRQQAKKQMLQALRQHTLPRSLRRASKLLGLTNSTVRAAAHDSTLLIAHFGLNAAAASSSTLLGELTQQADRRTRQVLQGMTAEKRAELELELQGMPPAEALELVMTLADDPDSGRVGDVAYIDELDQDRRRDQ